MCSKYLLSASGVCVVRDYEAFHFQSRKKPSRLFIISNFTPSVRDGLVWCYIKVLQFDYPLKTAFHMILCYGLALSIVAALKFLQIIAYLFIHRCQYPFRRHRQYMHSGSNSIENCIGKCYTNCCDRRLSTTLGWYIRIINQHNINLWYI